MKYNILQILKTWYEKRMQNILLTIFKCRLHDKIILSIKIFYKLLSPCLSPFFVLFRLSMGLDDSHPHWGGWPALPSPLVQMLVAFSQTCPKIRFNLDTLWHCHVDLWHWPPQWLSCSGLNLDTHSLLWGWRPWVRAVTRVRRVRYSQGASKKFSHEDK